MSARRGAASELMNAYSITLVVHSYLRWLILLVLAIVLVRTALGWSRGREWTRTDEGLHAALVGTTDLQLLIGIVLYAFLSPIPRALFLDAAAAMREPTLRFFGVEHAFAMIVAVAALHVGRVRSKKVAGRERHRRVFMWGACFLVIVIAGIPWPFLKHGRPLFRAEEAVPASSPQHA